MAESYSHQQTTALYVSAFFDELARWGVREVVVSPGSRSTALAMCAYEMSFRFPERLRVYVDIDERGASFFALGLAKASGRPVALVCTSGTAVANYYPAVVEAATSRVPLVVLSGDRPMRLQGVGAPQTCDQVKMFGDYVRRFQQMPEPRSDAQGIAFVRQAAREAVLAAVGPGASVSLAQLDACLGLGARKGLSQAGGGCARTSAKASAELLDDAVKAAAAEGAADETCAEEVVVASRGCAHMAGPVHFNFPFDEPLKPDFSVVGLFEAGRRDIGGVVGAGAAAGGAPGAAASKVDVASGVKSCEAERDWRPFVCEPLMRVRKQLDPDALAGVAALLSGRRTLVLAGEGSCETAAEASDLIAWAARWKFPLLADPLSGLRGFSDACIIDNYDNVFRASDAPMPDVVIRFGRFPISKPTNMRLMAGSRLAEGALAGGAAQAYSALGAPEGDASVEEDGIVNIVVDAGETRDWGLATDAFVACTPVEFVRQNWGAAFDAAGDNPTSANRAAEKAEPTQHAHVPQLQQAFYEEWVARNDAERARILAVEGLCESEPAFEGAIVRKMLQLIPEGSCLFSASSMPIRALDTFLVKEGKPLAVLCNRGQNGIDGTVSTALGAAQCFGQTTFLTGDFTLLHDMNALALQRELRVHHGPASGEPERSVVIVLLNNNGGAIFDMLPQRSDDFYFERLFLVPQDVRFEHAAAAFGVPYKRVSSVGAFAQAYEEFLGTPGISLVEVAVSLRGVQGRYAPYQAER